MAERKVKVVNPNKRIVLELQLFTVKKGEKEKVEGMEANLLLFQSCSAQPRLGLLRRSQPLKLPLLSKHR